MIKRIENRKAFSFEYFGYGVTKMFAACSCCQEYLVRKWPYYKKSMIAYLKYRKARSDLMREKDVRHMIYNMRILRFM